jgi:CTP:molybdopterin cytidylyltransferase MocA
MIPLNHTALIVLAAGRSSRMGMPKALAVFEGRTLLAHVLKMPLVGRFGDVVVVLGHDAEAIAAEVAAHGVRNVVNPVPDRGRTGSVQTGLHALGPKIEAAFVQPVDCPVVRAETYLALCEAMDDADVAVPMLVRQETGGEPRRGHPPLVAARCFPHILAAAAVAPLRELLEGPGVRRRLVPVEDPGVLVNVNRPEDLRNIPSSGRSDLVE